MKSTGIADTAYFGPELEFFVFDDVRYDQTQHSGYYFLDSVEGAWNTGRDEKPNLGYKLRYKEGYFPVPAVRRAARHPHRDDADDDRVRPEGRGPAPRGRHRRPGRDRHAVRPARRDGRQRAEVQVHRQERRHASTARRRPSCPSRCSRTTAPACTSTRRCGRTATTCSPARGYAGLSDMAMYAIGGLLQARPGPVRHHQSDDQQLQAAGARLRGAGQPGLQPPQSLGVDPHSRLLAAARRPSASSSAAPTARAIRTSPSRPC